MDDWNAIELASRYVSLGRGDRALSVLQDGSAELVETWLWRANALHLLARYDEAIEAARCGIAIQPENSFLHHAVARGELMLGQADAAEAAVLEALRLFPDEPNALALYASILTAQGRRREASRAIRRAAELAPEEPGVRVIEAMVTEPLDDEAAVRISRELLEARPEGAVEHWWHGRMLVRRGRLRDAADHFSRAAALDPVNPFFASSARVSRHWIFWPLRVTSPVLYWLAWYSILPILIFAADFGGVLWLAFWGAVAWSGYAFTYLLAHRWAAAGPDLRSASHRRQNPSSHDER